MRSLRIAAAVVILAVPLGARAQDVKALIETIKTGDAVARQQAVEEMVKIGGRAVGPLVKLLYGPDTTAHATARLALQRMVGRSMHSESEHARYEVAQELLIQALARSGNSVPARNAALEYLSLIAEDKQIAGLATLLNDKDVREMARFALVRIPYPAAGRKLAAALPGADPEFQVALVNSLTERAALLNAMSAQTYVPVINARNDMRKMTPPILRKLLPSPHENVRIAAMEALARLPDPDSSASIWTMATKRKGRERAVARDSYLRLAEAILARGDFRKAAEMYQRVYKTPDSVVEKCAALAGITRSSTPTAAAPLLLDALNAPEREVRGLAAQSLVDSPAPQVTEGLTQALLRADQETRALLVSVLGRRAGDDALAAVMAATRDAEESVRVAAFRALAGRKDVEKTRLLDLYHRALPAAAGHEEQAVILAGIERLADPASLPVLRSALERGQTRSLIYSAMLPIAEKMAQGGQKEEAVALYRQALEQAGEVRVVREAAAKLRGLGVQVDLVSQLGFVGAWWVLGPIPGREEWKTKDAIPTDTAIDTGQERAIGGQNLRWKFVPLDDPTGMLDLQRAVARRSDVAAYAYAEVVSPAEQDALFKIGSDDDVVCWLNGRKAHEFLGDRGWGADQDTIPVRLTAGVNRILLKVLNGGGEWACSLRITDRDGKPLKLEQRKP